MSVANNPSRQCGTCTLCCKLLEITEIEKPVNTWCPHCATGQGCRIYSDRPSECRNFSCGWLLDAQMADEWRPDKSKLIIFPDAHPEHILIHVDPGYPDAWRQEPYHSRIRQRAAQALRNGGYVLVLIKGKLTMILPQGEIFIGNIAKGERIEVHQSMGPEGTHYEARRVKAAVPQE